MEFSKIRQLNLLLFLTLFFTFSFFFQGGFSNQNTRFDFSLSIAFDRSITINSFHQNTIDKVKINDDYFMEKAPGSSYLALPIAVIASFFITKEQIQTQEQIGNLLLYFATIFTVSFLSALSAIYFRKILLLINPKMTLKNSFLFTLTTYLCTLILPYSTVLFGHQIASSLLVIGFYYGLSTIEGSLEKGTRYKFASLSCLLLGFAVFTEFPTAILAVFLALSILVRSNHKIILLKSCTWTLVPAICLLIHNYISFGNPLSFGYGKLQGTPFASQMNQGVFGITFPDMSALLELLFGKYRGLFWYSPILLIPIMGLLKSAKSNRTFICLICVGCLSMLLLNSSYSYWQGGMCFGPRHLVTIIPFICLGFSYIPTQWIKNPLFIIFTVISFIVNFAATITTLFANEYDTNPLFNTYSDLILNGTLSHNPLGFITHFMEIKSRYTYAELYPWSSFNLGELMGLTGYYSLTPLIVFWVIIFVFVKKMYNR